MGSSALLHGRPDSVETSTPIGPRSWLLFALVAAITLVAAIGGFASYASGAGETAWMRGEGGVVEMGTFILAAAAMVLAAIAAFRWKGSRRGRTWLIMLAIGGLYWAGEEVSWGQRVFQFRTPAGYAEINAQKETTIHNIEFEGKYRRVLRMVVDYIPRSLITLGAVLCLILPFLKRTRRQVLSPHVACIPPAIAVILFDARAFGKVPEGGELTELMMSIMLALYLAVVVWRIRRLDS